MDLYDGFFVNVLPCPLQYLIMALRCSDPQVYPKEILLCLCAKIGNKGMGFHL